MVSQAAASTAITTKDDYINIYTRMLWYDNDRRLWQNIQQRKREDPVVGHRETNAADRVPLMYWFLGWLRSIAAAARAVWDVCRRLRRRR